MRRTTEESALLSWRLPSYNQSRISNVLLYKTNESGTAIFKTLPPDPETVTIGPNLKVGNWRFWIVLKYSDGRLSPPSNVVDLVVVDSAALPPEGVSNLVIS